MSTPISFTPASAFASGYPIAHEWLVAVMEDGVWVRASNVFDDKDEAKKAAAATPGGVLIGRETSPWAEIVEPRPREEYEYDGRMDPIVNRLIDGENADIRHALEADQSIAVTRYDKPRDRVAHRIGCPTLTDLLDREKAWSTNFRQRLAEDHTFRPALPTFMTRDAARNLQLRECKVCAPDLTDTPPPIRSLSAEGLSDHHIGLDLVTDGGSSQGIITDIDLHRSETTQRWSSDRVTVTTETGKYEYAGKDRVFVLTAVNKAAIARQEKHVRELVGAA